MTEALELPNKVSDGDLARAAAEGDRRSFAEIYDRYADRLYDFCVGLLGDRDAAADCVQDAFCVAASDLGDLREPDKLRPWLYSIARHHAMRRLRHRYREEVSDELPDMVSQEASPETLAGQSELARLVAEAADGLSDRDRELLDLSYRHGLDGPEIAEALGVTLTSANTMMFRLRQTVERCLGALLVARSAQANPGACPELTPILKGWDGHFSVLMRKRMARHIDSCATCEQDQNRQVNPVALLGGSAVFIPAPAWLRQQTLDRVELTCASSSLTEASGSSEDSGVTEASGLPEQPQGAGKRRLALTVGIPLVCLGLAVTWFARSEDPVSRVVDTGIDSGDRTLPMIPAAVGNPPAPSQPRQVNPVGTGEPTTPTRQAQATAYPDATSQTPDAVGPDPAPLLVLPTQNGSADFPGPDPKPVGPRSQGGNTPGTTLGPIAPGGTTPGGPTVIDTGIPAAPGGPVDLGPLPNPDLDTKIVPSYPKTNTGIISGPTAKVPNLQPSNPAKTDTTKGTTNGGTTGNTTTGGTTGNTTNGGTTGGTTGNTTGNTNKGTTNGTTGNTTKGTTGGTTSGSGTNSKTSSSTPK